MTAITSSRSCGRDQLRPDQDGISVPVRSYGEVQSAHSHGKGAGRVCDTGANTVETVGSSSVLSVIGILLEISDGWVCGAQPERRIVHALVPTALHRVCAFVTIALLTF